MKLIGAFEQLFKRTVKLNAQLQITKKKTRQFMFQNHGSEKNRIEMMEIVKSQLIALIRNDIITDLYGIVYTV